MKLKRGKRWKQALVAVRPISAPRWSKLLIAGALVVAAFALVISPLISFHRAPPTTRALAPRAADVVGALAGIPEKSIAVLPFENLSSERENAYFADGIQDEILTLLSKIADLKVISRTSTQLYKSARLKTCLRIAKQLGVAHILEGSVQKSGDTERVNVQLIGVKV